ncbi:hypothetical protein O0I10_009368 [Lichtheimia ornata]|uniref:PH domain-containing protein n=1 Tax=Lichtheimia ornata TaxID=688661 RepID=A0AAD7UX01_9FUNG|nr:uncharacterized protein O0I10_009368 [Lichtheimia ornata]KAJ8654972.1 hypothetical protein O0I10_009368 [Lichtheimia ornata]
MPLFEDQQIDLFRLLLMKNPSDYINIGICDADDYRRLCHCIRAIHSHLSYKGLVLIGPNNNNNNNTTTTNDIPESPSSSHSVLSIPANAEEQENILRVIDAVDRYALPSLSSSSSSAWIPSSPPTPPFSKSTTTNNITFTPHDKQKSSVRSSFLSVLSESTITTTVEEEEEEEDEIPNEIQQQHPLDHTTTSSYHQQLEEDDHHRSPPPAYNDPDASTSSILTSPSSSINRQETTTTTRVGRPGMVVPRPPKTTPPRRRPLSMPVCLVSPEQQNDDNNNNTSRPTSTASTINRRSLIVLSTSPPDYHDTALMKRWEKCRSCILPREEEGREELPPYKCTVYKMGHVHIKREMDAPGVRTRWRLWRKLYFELWGTVLRIYRASPHGSGYYSRLEKRLPSRLPLAQWSRYYYQPIHTLSLAGAEAGRAWDYTKRPHVLRLTTAHGPQLLLRLSSHVEMISWIEHLQAAINISLDLEQRPMPKFMTLPNRASINGTPMTSRALEIERARERRRRSQREMLI